MPCGNCWSWAPFGWACNWCRSFYWVRYCSCCSCYVSHGVCWQVLLIDCLSHNLAYKMNPNQQLNSWIVVWSMKLTGQKLDNSNSHSHSHSYSNFSRSCSRSWSNGKVWHQIKPINQQEKHFERGYWEGVLRGDWSGLLSGYCSQTEATTWGAQKHFRCTATTAKVQAFMTAPGPAGRSGAWLANRITKLLLKSWTNIGVSRILWGATYARVVVAVCV